MAIIPFLRNKPYPKWNYNKPDEVPGIPDWTVTFGNFIISFSEGNKRCYVSQKICGDYTIHITSRQHNWQEERYTDHALWENLLIPNITLLDNKENFITVLRKILNFTIESNVLNFINNQNYNDELKVCLYTLWHRAIIEDRLYPQPNYSGRKQVIGITIAIIKKLIGEKFPHEDLIEITPFLNLKLNVSKKCPECLIWYNLK